MMRSTMQWIAEPADPSTEPTVLIDRASERYRNAGVFAYNFARGKLRGDPVFRALLERGMLLGRGRILDLGCGQGLLAAWADSAAPDSAN